MTLKELMIKAHKRAKKYEGDYSACLSIALKNLWTNKKKKDAKDAKKARELNVKKQNTVRETEKAVLVACLIAINRKKFDSNYKSYYTEITEESEIWIPKSQIDQRTGKVSRWFRKEVNNFDNLYNA